LVFRCHRCHRCHQRHGVTMVTLMTLILGSSSLCGWSCGCWSCHRSQLRFPPPAAPGRNGADSRKDAVGWKASPWEGVPVSRLGAAQTRFPPKDRLARRTAIEPWRQQCHLRQRRGSHELRCTGMLPVWWFLSPRRERLGLVRSQPSAVSKSRPRTSGMPSPLIRDREDHRGYAATLRRIAAPTRCLPAGAEVKWVAGSRSQRGQVSRREGLRGRSH